jgi:GTP-binding protein
VEDLPGLTRDRLYAQASWRERTFLVVDTGGYVSDATESIQRLVRAQAEQAMEEADLILFVVDATSGILPEDREVAQRLREGRCPVLVVVNKADRADHPGVLEFYELSLGEPIPVSAIHGLGIGDLLDAVVEVLPASTAVPETAPIISVAVVGRPNVGKSSLVNAILGEERVLVDPVPGTTRDAVDTPFEWNGRHFVLIDTAGLRRKARIDQAVERFSAGRSLSAVDRSDIVVLVLEAGAPAVNQDQEIARYTVEKGRALVIAVNKWDLVNSTDRATPAQLAPVDRALRFVDYAPVVVTSAVKGWGIGRLLEHVIIAAASFERRVPTGPLNRVVEQAVQAHHPPADRAGRLLKIYYATQPAAKPPTFILFVNHPDLLTSDYRRYLDARLRGAFDFTGTPIRLVARARERSPKIAKYQASVDRE